MVSSELKGNGTGSRAAATRTAKQILTFYRKHRSTHIKRSYRRLDIVSKSGTHV